MKEILTLSALALLIAGPASSDETWYAPEDYDIAWVQITDSAKNGCWTNIGEVQTYAEDQMRLLGFNVVEEPIVGDEEASPVLSEDGIFLWINVVGERLNSGLCVGYVNTTFFATMINPKREDFAIVNPVGLTAQPFSIWTGKNFNTYTLDYIKQTLPVWVERGVIDDQ